MFEKIGFTFVGASGFRRTVFVAAGVVVFAVAGAEVSGFSVLPDEDQGVVIVLPDEAVGEERNAADELALYLERVTGRNFPVKAEGEYDGAASAFFVGETERSGVLDVDWAELDEDAVVLYSVDSGLVLRGREAHGTEFAVYRFLNRFGGVRWYMPGELGEHVPERSEWVLPEIQIVEEPSFLARRFSGLRGEEAALWQKRNLMRGRDHFHHNLHRIFNEELYEEHPEYFLLRNGDRVRPDDSIGGYNMQICYGNPEAARVAAEAAIRAFEEDPELESFSLGMLDTDPICECRLCQKWVDPQRSFRDKPDYSDLLFTFMNRAAEVVEARYPDRYLGCLAYHWAENTPSFPVHPMVLPYLTADRPMWVHPDFREEDKALMRRWGERVPRVGIYDYYFGQPYVIPRHFFEVIEESLRYAGEQGVQGFYGQLSPIWSVDGPKGWLTAQLLWRTEQEGAELLGEFYEDFYGAAAGPMRGFFELAERQWRNQSGRANWLKYYADVAQMELFPPQVCAEARELLDEASALADGDRAKERVALVSEGFQRTERLSEIYHGLMGLARMPLGTEEEGRVFWAKMKAVKESDSRLQRFHENTVEEDPLRRQGLLWERYMDHPSRRILGRVEEFVDWGRRHGELEQVEASLEAWDKRFPQTRALLALELAQARQQGAAEVKNQVLFDPQWEASASLYDSPGEWWKAIEGGELWPWMRTFRAGTQAGFSVEERPEGGVELRASGAVEEQIYLYLPAEEGALYEFSALAKGSNGNGSQVRLRLYWYDRQGALMDEEGRALFDQLGEGTTEGREKLTVISRAPEGVGYAYLLLEVNEQAEKDFVVFDRVEMTWVNP